VKADSFLSCVPCVSISCSGVVEHIFYPIFKRTVLIYLHSVETESSCCRSYDMEGSRCMNTVPQASENPVADSVLVARHKGDFAQYPYPKIPLSPILSENMFTRAASARQVDSILSNSNVRMVTSGRAAIALALEDAGIIAGDEVLVPAFHCESMISPVRWREATPVFFRVLADAQVDLEDLFSKLTGNTKAVLVTHYFGVLQNLEPIRKFCDLHGLVLIEDCAHAFFGNRDGLPVGTVGDYAIASSMKFFPNFDGGVLASSTRDLSVIKLQPHTWSFQLQSFFNITEKAISFKRFGLLGRTVNLAIICKDLLWKAAKGLMSSNRKQQFAPPSSEGGFGLEESQWIHKVMSLASSKVIDLANYQQISEARTSHYAMIDRRLRGLPGAKPFYDHLPQGTVPLVYPLYVENLDEVFHHMKMAGVPIWRFGELLDPAINADVCSISVHLSEHVIQFPCHQSLRLSEIEWMLDQIEASFALFAVR